MKYKALFMDVDGTIVPSYTDGLPSEKVVNAIAKAREKGIHVGVVTGRPLAPFLKNNILNHLQLEGPSIILGGAQVIDSVSKKVLWQQALDPEDIPHLITTMSVFAKRIIINDNGKESPFDPKKKYKLPLAFYIPSLPSKEADSLIDKLSTVSSISAIKMTSWHDSQLDVGISHASATKLHGIVKVAEILKIQPEEIIGVGDSYNDFPLLMASGLKVAMGNAIEDLKAIADYVAPSVDEDGVADVIEKFILSPSSLRAVRQRSP